MSVTPKRDAAMQTGLCGYVWATRTELEALFGPPNMVDRDKGDPSGDDKVGYEWGLMAKGVQWRIYDYKEYRTIPADERFEWHIGGSHKALAVVAAYMPKHVVTDEKGKTIEPPK